MVDLAINTVQFLSMTQHIIQEAAETGDGRRIAPAASRNCSPLIEALQPRMPKTGRVLEIASGTGQHAAAFASAFPKLEWIPSDVDAEQRESISAWRAQSALKNLAEPLALDVAKNWPIEPETVQAILTVNLLHLVPQAYVDQLFENGRMALVDGGRLIVYGPFLRGADYASQGDREFDASLRERDSTIGYKSIEAVKDTAQKQGFMSVADDAMPANNLLLTFGRES